MKSNGTTFYVPAALQLRRAEDFARGMRSDVTDYQAMRARTQRGAAYKVTTGQKMRPRGFVMYELRTGEAYREFYASHPLLSGGDYLDILKHS